MKRLDRTAGGFFFWCAGAEPRHLTDSAVERARYVATGAAVVLTACAALLSMSIALSLAFGGFRWYFPFVGAFWGLFVFNVDRWLVSGVHYGRHEQQHHGDPPGGAGRWTGYVGRLLLAAFFALAISEPIVLLLFDKEIQQQIAVTHTHQKVVAERQIRALPKFTTRRRDIEQEVKDADRQLEAADTKQTNAGKEADGEERGTSGTGVPGCARDADSACLRKRDAYNKAKAEYQKALTKDNAVHDAYPGKIAALERDINTAVADRYKAIDDSNGLVARWQALAAISRQFPELGRIHFVITGLFLLVDMMPVLLKAAGSVTLHDRRVRVWARSKIRMLDGDRLDTEHRADAEEERHENERRRENRRRQVDAEADAEQDRIKYRRKEAARRDKYAHWKAVQDIDNGAVQDIDNGFAGAAWHQPGFAPPASAPPSVGPTGNGSQAESVPGPASTPTPDLASVAGSTPGPGPDPAPSPAPGPITMPAPVPGPIPQQRPRPGRSWFTSAPSRLVLNGIWVVDQELRADAGGQGNTFLGHHIGNAAQRVVIKRRHVDADADRDAVMQPVWDEFRKQSSVRHDNVAEVWDCGYEPTFGPFLVTRYYLKGTIAKRLKESPPVTVAWCLEAVRQALEGLVACVVQATLLHLDIKPENIVLDDDGSVRLIDFGLAKVAPSGTNAVSSGVGAGMTPFYAPLEQIDQAGGSGWRTSAVDVWAIGATLYRMLSGLPPLVREARRSYPQQQLFLGAYLLMRDGKPPTPLHELDSRVPVEVGDLVDQWLAHEPTARAPGPEKFAVQNALAQLEDLLHQLGRTRLLTDLGGQDRAPTAGRAVEVDRMVTRFSDAATVLPGPESPSSAGGAP